MESQINADKCCRRNNERLNKTIFCGMPSLLDKIVQTKFAKSWPESKDLPGIQDKLSQNIDNNFEVFNLGNIFQIGKKRLRQQLDFEIKSIMRVSKCPHASSKHYAKNMCSVCYHRMRKMDKEIICGHKDRTVFARGMCSSCYYHMAQSYKRNKGL